MKASTALTALFPVAALAAVFPQPDGPYQVTWESSELIDESRLDPFNSSHPRRIMITRFSPVTPSRCKKTCRVPYMPPDIASIEDDILIAYFGDIGWPAGVLAGLKLELCCEVHHGQPEKHRFPTILFGTGLNTTRLFYSATAQQLASLGYEIIVMDHPYETDVVQFPDGEIIFGGRIGRDPNDTVTLQFGLDVRTRDASFVLDTFKVCKTTYIGQSFGGAAAADAMLHDHRIAGGVNLDGIMFGPAIETGVAKPFFVFGSDGHNSSSEPSWMRFFDSMASQRPDVWTKELSMADSSHGSYTDYSIIGDITGLRDNEELLFFFGKALGSRVMEVLRAYLGAFIEFTMKRVGEGLLAGPSERFPDVSFLRSWQDD